MSLLLVKRFGLLLLISLFMAALVLAQPVFAQDPPGPSPDGFNTIEDKAWEAGTLGPGSEAVVQEIYVEDNDDNDSLLTVTSAIIDNMGEATPEYIAKVEVSASTEVVEEFDKKGEASVDSFPVKIDISSFDVADNGSAKVRIKVFIADQVTSSGTLQLQTTLVHNEGSSIGIRRTATDGVAEKVQKSSDKPQIATFNRGTWWVDANDNGTWDGPGTDIKVKGFGNANNQVAAADFDDDGKAEIATFAHGTWWKDMNDNGVWDGEPIDSKVVGYGTAGNKVAAGDFDGDEKAEIATFNRGTWWIDLNNNDTWDGEPDDKKVEGFGNANNQVAAADFNGDGKAEIATFTAGTWWKDLNGNGKWDGEGTDEKVEDFGTAGNKVAAGQLSHLGSTNSATNLNLDTAKSLTINKTTAYPNPVSTNDTVTFRVRGKNIASTKLEVFTASGKRMYTTNYTQGTTHTWNLTTDEGKPVTNGVYLYQLKAKGEGGQTTTSQFRKLLVLR